MARVGMAEDCVKDLEEGDFLWNGLKSPRLAEMVVLVAIVDP